MKYIRLFFLFCFLFPLASWATQQTTPRVLVSIAPYRTLVERIAGDKVEVQVMVPPGASAHTYDPSPKQMMRAGEADLWFTLGESFEEKARKAMETYNPNLRIIDLREGIPLLQSHCTHSHSDNCKEGADPHLWLSPKVAREQVRLITNALSARYPESTATFQSNAAALDKDLQALDAKIQEITKNAPQRTLMVSHPAYGYFARDYGFRQLPIEFEGKDPSPKQLGRLFEEAKNQKIHKIYVQPQHSAKGARLIAQQIGAEVVVLDPYREDYFAFMEEAAQAFANQESP